MRYNGIIESYNEDEKLILNLRRIEKSNPNFSIDVSKIKSKLFN